MHVIARHDSCRSVQLRLSVMYAFVKKEACMGIAALHQFAFSAYVPLKACLPAIALHNPSCSCLPIA